ncbi:MAG: glycosyltransferase, partial [Bacteroidales bacterium]|nr:glycosyltransferase [Bacteroidales bacterium]
MSNVLHICILIPAFNNGGTVGAVVERALATGLPVIVVNDGSTDGTAEILS